MKTLIVLAALCACTLADSLYAYNTIPYSSVYPYTAAYSPAYTPYASTYYPTQHYAAKKSAVIPNVVPSNINKQYHAQDNLGQFSFGYSNPLSARSEIKSADGTVAGQYSYVQPQGNVVQVKYVADSQGYRVEDSVPQTIGFRSKRDTPASTYKVPEARQLYYPTAVGSQYYVYPGSFPVVHDIKEGNKVNIGQQYALKTVLNQQPLVATGYNPYYSHVYPYGAVPVVYSKDSLIKGTGVSSIGGAEFPKTVVQA